jgi:hypothetical protein
MLLRMQLAAVPHAGYCCAASPQVLRYPLVKCHALLTDSYTHSPFVSAGPTFLDDVLVLHGG